MSPNRRSRVWTHWWVPVSLGAVAVVAATLLTDFRNDRRPQREAVAPMTLLAGSGDVGDEPTADQLTSARGSAEEVNARLLSTRVHAFAPWKIAEIEIDESRGRLLFIGRGDTDSQAIAVATELRRTYLDSERDIADEPLLSQQDHISLRPSSLDRVAALPNQALALLGGLFIGALALVVADLTRAPARLHKGAGSVALSEITPRDLAAPSDLPWFPRAGSHPRRETVQSLRAWLEGAVDGNGTTVGISGISVDPQEVQELAADLGMAFASEGSSVLLLDVNFEHPAALAEFSPDHTSLAMNLHFGSLLGGLGGEEEAIAEARHLLLDRTEVAPGLRSFRAGAGSSNQTSLLTGPEFTTLLRAAEETFDLVIVAGTDVDHPATQILDQSLDSMMLLGATGRTSRAAVKFAERKRGPHQATLIRLILLKGRPGRLQRSLARVLPALFGSGVGHGPLALRRRSTAPSPVSRIRLPQQPRTLEPGRLPVEKTAPDEADQPSTAVSPTDDQSSVATRLAESEDGVESSLNPKSSGERRDPNGV